MFIRILILIFKLIRFERITCKKSPERLSKVDIKFSEHTVSINLWASNEKTGAIQFFFRKIQIIGFRAPMLKQRQIQ